MLVTYFQRRPQGANFSIERLFNDIRGSLPKGIEKKVVVCRFPSRGIIRRIYNIIEAIFHQGDINHITGDVHYLALFLSKRRTILTIHDLVSAHRLSGVKRTLFLFFWYWLPIKRSAIVTVISEFTKEELLRHFQIKPEKLRVVFDCVSNDFIPIPKEFNPFKPVILQVGTGPNKNLERLAIALKGIPCHLRVIGNLKATQVAILQESGVDFSSISGISDQEICEEYAQCDMLVFASTYEGFGLPIVEAQATGRPVVTAKCGPMPEVAGDGACLVDPFDVHDIRNGILKVIHDATYRGDLIRKGLENVKRFRASTIAAQYSKIYEELLSKA